MIATMPTFRQSAPFDSSSGDFVLRICGSSRNGQIVRLKSTKCTIGSGPQCTLRLRAAGVGPLHCLLLRGRTGTIVRCWSPDTRLNHQAFSDAVLSPGDRLGIGPIELEVLGVGATTAAERPKIEDGEIRRVAAERQQLAAQLAKLETDQNALAAERREWEAERDEIQRTADDDCKQLSARLAKLELEQNTLAAERYTLGAEQNALNAERNALAAERREWETERGKVQGAGEAERKQLTDEIAKLETEKKALAAERDALAVEQNALKAERNTLATEQETLAAERNTLTTEQETLAAERNTLAEELRQWERQQAEFVAQPESARLETQEPQESQVQPVAASSERAPVDLDDVFRRIGVKLNKAEDEEAALTPGPSPIGRGEEVVPGPSPLGRREEAAYTGGVSPKGREEEGEGKEESIDDYMDRLMQRIRPDSGAPAPSSKTTPRKATNEAANAVTASTVESAESQAASPMSLAPNGFDPNETRPRAKPPENRTDMSAFRELANLSARSAIGHHARKVLIHTIYSKLAVAGVGLFAGVLLLWLWMRYGVWEMTFYSALAAILVAIYWGVQYALLTGRLIIDKSGSIDLGRRDSSSEASPDVTPGAPKE